MDKFLIVALAVLLLASAYQFCADDFLFFDKVSDNFWLSFVPQLFGMRSCNENGSFGEYKEELLNDHLNDEIAQANTYDVLLRSGYKYEDYLVESDDGYFTHLIRIVNPLASRAKLKQPPVALYHGGTVDTTSHLYADAIQHHPEKYPRSYREDGPITSSNRSIGFMLANNGYDVWLVNTRSGNEFNLKWNANKSRGSKSNYWDYSFDEIIQHELVNQIDKILKVTGAKKVSLQAFSYSTILWLSFLSQNEQFARNKVHTLALQAPLISLEGTNRFFRFVMFLFRFLTPDIASPLAERLIFSQLVRDLIVALGRNPKMRYNLVKGISTLFLGSSAQYRTKMELPYLGHFAQPIAHKQTNHFFQIASAQQLQKYDYGEQKNLKVYGQSRPPAYDISRIQVKNTLVISGTNDNIGTAKSAELLLKALNPKPVAHINIEGYNHLDFMAAVDNDILTNLPLLKFYDRFQISNPRELKHGS